MIEKKQLKEDKQIKQIIEKNQDIIDAMRKLNEMLEHQIQPPKNEDESESKNGMKK